MAQIQFGSIIVDARGKIGGQVFRKTATGHTLQRKANQSKNARVGRTQQFQQLVGSLRMYSQLSAEDKQAVADFASLHPLPNKFGVLRTLPARAMYQKLNSNLLTAGLSVVNVRTLSSVLPMVVVDNVSFNLLGKTLDFEVTADSYPFYLRVYYSATQGDALSVDISRKRLMSVKNVTAGGALDIPLNIEQLDIFTNFQGTVFAGFQAMNSSGWVGAVQWFRV